MWETWNIDVILSFWSFMMMQNSENSTKLCFLMANLTACKFCSQNSFNVTFVSVAISWQSSTRHRHCQPRTVKGTSCWHPWLQRQSRWPEQPETKVELHDTTSALAKSMAKCQRHWPKQPETHVDQVQDSQKQVGESMTLVDVSIFQYWEYASYSVPPLTLGRVLHFIPRSSWRGVGFI